MQFHYFSIFTSDSFSRIKIDAINWGTSAHAASSTPEIFRRLSATKALSKRCGTVIEYLIHGCQPLAMASRSDPRLSNSSARQVWHSAGGDWRPASTRRPQSIGGRALGSINDA